MSVSYVAKEFDGFYAEVGLAKLEKDVVFYARIEEFLLFCEQFIPIVKLSNMMRLSSLNSWNIALTWFCKMELAGLIPSGINLGRIGPSIVIIDSSSDVASSSLN